MATPAVPTSRPSEQPSPGVRIATVGGVPVYIGRSWPVIALLVVLLFGPQIQSSRPDLGGLAYAVAALFAVLLLFSVLAHEACHAVVARRFGYSVNRVVADLWGGHTAYDSGTANPGASALVAVAGPVANGLLAVLGWLLAQNLHQGGVLYLLVNALVWTNAFVAVFNMLPGLPLDGGFLVDSLVWRLTGSRESGLIAAGWSGRVVTVLVLAWALLLPLSEGRPPSLFDLAWAGLIGAFLWAGATNAIRTGRTRKVLQGLRLDAVWRAARTLPLAATAEQAWETRVAGHAAVVVVDAAGHEVGLVDDDALGGIPPAVRSSTPLTALMRTQPAGWVVTASPDEPVTGVAETMQRLGLLAVPIRTSAGAEVRAIVLASDLQDALSRGPSART
jgi:Zn-dependent protease